MLNIKQIKQGLADQWERTSAIASKNWNNMNNSAEVGIVNEKGVPYLNNDSLPVTPVDYISTLVPASYYEDTVTHPKLGDKLTATLARYPVRSGAAVLGGLVANQMLGKPVEGLIDFATFDIGNFRPNTHEQQSIQPVQVAGQVPPLSAKDADYEIDRLRKNIARDMITLNQLEQMQTSGQVR